MQVNSNNSNPDPRLRSQTCQNERDFTIELKGKQGKEERL